jgi:hypothetical protein
LALRPDLTAGLPFRGIIPLPFSLYGFAHAFSVRQITFCVFLRRDRSHPYLKRCRAIVMVMKKMQRAYKADKNRWQTSSKKHESPSSAIGHVFYEPNPPGGISLPLL